MVRVAARTPCSELQPQLSLEGDVRVEDIMSEAVQTVAPATEADRAWNLMRTQGIHHLVVTEGRRIIGVISDRDLGGRRGASVRKNQTVRDLMSKAVVTVPPTTPVRKAANLMRGRSIGCLVVSVAERALGIITVADLLELIGRGTERPVAATTRWTLKHRAPHHHRTKASGVW
jgi:CBS domain-containing protein